MNDPYTLTTDRAGEPELGHQSDTPWRRGRDIAPELGGVWTGAFVMGATERANRAAQQRIARLGVRQQVPLRGEHEPRLVGRRAGCRRDGHGRQCRRPRRWAAGTSTSCRDGLRGAHRAEARHRSRVNAPGTRATTGSRPTPPPRRGARYRATMAQQGDLGYKATSVLLGECGLALAFDRDRLSDLRGVLTPAACMGDALLARFPAAGVIVGDRTAGLTVIARAARNACQPRSKRLVSQARLCNIPATKVDMTWLVSTISSTEIPVQDIASKLGVDEGEVNTAIHTLVPALVGGLQHNVQADDIDSSKLESRRHHAGRQRSARRRRQRRSGRRARGRQDRRQHLRRQRQRPGRLGAGGRRRRQRRPDQEAAADPGSDRARLHRQAAHQGRGAAAPAETQAQAAPGGGGLGDVLGSILGGAAAAVAAATTRSAASSAACSVAARAVGGARRHPRRSARRQEVAARQPARVPSGGPRTPGASGAFASAVAGAS